MATRTFVRVRDPAWGECVTLITLPIGSDENIVAGDGGSFMLYADRPVPDRERFRDLAGGDHRRPDLVFGWSTIGRWDGPRIAQAHQGALLHPSSAETAIKQRFSKSWIGTNTRIMAVPSV